jgi:ureidoglycolate lyase
MLPAELSRAEPSTSRSTASLRGPAALPGDDVKPESSVTFRCSGNRGLYIHRNIWHGAVVPLDDHARFLNRQGRVHARISVDLAKEFGCYLAAPMRRPDA